MPPLLWNGAIIVGAVLLLSGFSLLRSPDQSTGTVAFSVTESVYAPGDSIDRRLENGTATPIGYNLCFSTLERRTDAGWRAVQNGDPDNDSRLEVCSAVQRLLDAGDATTSPTLLPTDLEPGAYRFRADVERPDGRTWVVRTDRFSVRE